MSGRYNFRSAFKELLAVYHDVNNATVAHLEVWVGDELLPFYYANGVAVTDETLLADLSRKETIFENMAIVEMKVEELRFRLRQKKLSAKQMARFFIDGYERMFFVVAQITTNFCLAFGASGVKEIWAHRYGEMLMVTSRVLLRCKKLVLFLWKWANIAQMYHNKLNRLVVY